MSLQALIFDVDGTLAETEEVHRRAFNEIFVEHGIAELFPDPENQWRWSQALYGELLRVTGGKERIAAYASRWLGHDPAPRSERIAALHVAKTERYAAIIDREGIALRPGIAELVDDARASGIRLAIATTTSLSNVQALCQAAFGQPAEQLFEVIAAGDQVPAKKPAPDIYLAALQRLGLPAETCIALEDSANGLSAAVAAGVRCVVSPSLYCADDDVEAAALRVECFREVANVGRLKQALAAVD